MYKITEKINLLFYKIVPAEEVKLDDKGLTDLNDVKYFSEILANVRAAMPEIDIRIRLGWIGFGNMNNIL